MQVSLQGTLAERTLMKNRTILLFLVFLLSATTLIGCDRKVNTSSQQETTISTVDETEVITTPETTIDIKNLESELSDITDKYNKINKIYDDSLVATINQYCSNYLSFKGNATDNIDKISDCVTRAYMNTLKSQAGHEQQKVDYQQSTGIEKKYYSDYSNINGQINILALCSQTVTYNNKVKNIKCAYEFEMFLDNNVWKINNVNSVMTNISE